MYCETVLRNTTSSLTVWSILLYVDGDVHDLDLNLHPSALLHGGIPMCFRFVCKGTKNL